MALFNFDIVDEKAFELAVRDPVYRKKRIEELKRLARVRCGGGISAMIPICGLSILFFQNPRMGQFTWLLCLYVGAFWFVFAMSLLSFRQASHYDSDARLLQMLDIQDRIAEGRKSEP